MATYDQDAATALQRAMLSRQDAANDGAELAQESADAAGVSATDVRIIQEGPDWVLLLGEQWVVGSDPVREWQSESDPLYDSALDMDALPDSD